MMIIKALFSFILFYGSLLHAQLKWQNVDSMFQPLPASVHIYFSDQQIDTGAFRAYYLIADLQDRKLDFTADTTLNRRLTPAKFYEKNNQPLVVVNCTFFSFETNRSLNTVIKEGSLVAYNQQTINGRGKDSFTYRHPFGSAIGISKHREADIAWLFTDSSMKFAYATQISFPPLKDSLQHFTFDRAKSVSSIVAHTPTKSFLNKWKMMTAVGGGPVLLQNGQIAISNNEELKFAGKAINDKHPRTAMGYTTEGKLIILMIEGRNKVAHGATLTQEAQIFKELGCVEALNLDGGGSSCMLVNGQETIKVSDATGERPVPAVFIIKRRK